MAACGMMVPDARPTDAAVAALRHYDVSPQAITLAAESFNSIFRVTTASAVYALRVGAALHIHPEGTGAVEAAWHLRLRHPRTAADAAM